MKNRRLPSFLGDKKLESFSASFVNIGRGPTQASVFSFTEETVLHFFKTAARTTRNYCALTYRARTPTRSIRARACVCVCVRVCIHVWYESVPHTYISSFKRHVTTRSVDLLIWNRVRAGTLEKRPRGNNMGAGAYTCREMNYPGSTSSLVG